MLSVVRALRNLVFKDRHTACKHKTRFHPLDERCEGIKKPGF